MKSQTTVEISKHSVLNKFQLNYKVCNSNSFYFKYLTYLVHYIINAIKSNHLNHENYIIQGITK